MAQKPTCANCGREMRATWAERPCCTECRKHGKAVIKVTHKRNCKTCGTGFVTTNNTKVYCAEGCRPTRSPDRKLSSSARGYDSTHQKVRLEWKTQVDAGLIACCLCGLPINPSDKWHLDHTEDRTSYRGAAHATCNLREGQRRSALTVIAKHYGVDRADLVAWLKGAGFVANAS